MTKPLPWKIDGNKSLPLAIIEDTAEGFGVVEFGKSTPEKLKLAKAVVKAHNAYLK